MQRESTLAAKVILFVYHNVKEFPVFTSDLHEIAKHLRSYNVKTVSLESTGFYWKPLFVLLQDYGGERNPLVLEKLVSKLCKSERSDIQKALEGDWREEYLFELQDCHDLYHFYWEKIRNIDKEIERLLVMNSQAKTSNVKKDDYKPSKQKQYHKNDPKFDVAAYAYEMTNGVDLMQIPGVGVSTILTMMTETGFDLSMFKTAKHFVSWFGFSPNRKISGGKVLSAKTRKKTNPLAKILRDAANTAGNSKTRLGDFFRRLAYRKGRAVAIAATARKIGVIIFNMLKNKEVYNYEYSEENTQRIQTIKKKYNITTNELNILIT